MTLVTFGPNFIRHNTTEEGPLLRIRQQVPVVTVGMDGCGSVVVAQLVELARLIVLDEKLFEARSAWNGEYLRFNTLDPENVVLPSSEQNSTPDSFVPKRSWSLDSLAISLVGGPLESTFESFERQETQRTRLRKLKCHTFNFSAEDFLCPSGRVATKYARLVPSIIHYFASALTGHPARSFKLFASAQARFAEDKLCERFTQQTCTFAWTRIPSESAQPGYPELHVRSHELVYLLRQLRDSVDTLTSKSHLRRWSEPVTYVVVDPVYERRQLLIAFDDSPPIVSFGPPRFPADLSATRRNIAYRLFFTFDSLLIKPSDRAPGALSRKIALRCTRKQTIERDESIAFRSKLCVGSRGLSPLLLKRLDSNLGKLSFVAGAPPGTEKVYQCNLIYRANAGVKEHECALPWRSHSISKFSTQLSTIKRRRGPPTTSLSAHCRLWPAITNQQKITANNERLAFGFKPLLSVNVRVSTAKIALQPLRREIPV